MKKLLLVVLVIACSGCAGRVREKLLIMEGNFHLSSGRYNQAIAAYMNALALSDAEPYGEFALGTAYMAMNEDAAALERFDRAKRGIAGRDSEKDRELLYRIVYNTGIIYFEAGNYGEAAGEFRNALKYDSGRTGAKRNLELSLLSLSQDKAASPDASRMEQFEAGEGGALLEYIRQKEREQWKSREESEDTFPGMDY
ncbi:MAG: tetratricopeptide repeat protein [Spirochaetaceae bacterium]|jgi:Ca-activated chloride channel family protein|nr:tetratricopeptide repeat protein [Spirochaetaceae bacterium]